MIFTPKKIYLILITQKNCRLADKYRSTIS